MTTILSPDGSDAQGGAGRPQRGTGRSGWAACVAAGVIGMAMASVRAEGAYIVSPMVAGQSGAIVAPGATFELDVVLASPTGAVHNSAIFALEFSTPGLEYLGYTWAAPYAAGTVFDDSLPRLDDLPTTLSPGTLTGPGYPDGVVDVELSNVAESGGFGVGVLATLTLRVPDAFPAQTVLITVRPDTFAMGFDEVPAAAGPAFELVVVPSPGAWLAAVFGAAAAVRRRSGGGGGCHRVIGAKGGGGRLPARRRRCNDEEPS